mgnify:CR=1 FL=1
MSSEYPDQTESKNKIIMQITGTHINYYLICQRKLWLFANGIHMEQTSGLVDEGRLIHETAYPKRAEKYQEIAMEGIKIDFYDPGSNTIHEIKKGKSMETAHEWQLKYYLFILQKNGIKDALGLLEYPKLRETKEIHLSEKDHTKIIEICAETEKIIQSENTPDRIKKNLCRSCSYFDFCWIEE